MKFSLHPQNVDAPVEKIAPENLPDADQKTTEAALEAVVNNSKAESNVSKGIHATVRSTSKIPFIHKLIPGLETLANKYHVGNYVAIRCAFDQSIVPAPDHWLYYCDRGGDETFFESMPIYARYIVWWLHCIICWYVDIQNWNASPVLWQGTSTSPRREQDHREEITRTVHQRKWGRSSEPSYLK